MDFCRRLGVSACRLRQTIHIKINYSVHCHLDKGALFRSPGAVIRTEDAMLLAALAPGWKDPIQYLDLKTGEHRGEPAGVRAAFADWSLFQSIDDKEALFRLIAKPIDPSHL